MGKTLARNITLHAKDETGAYQTFRFRAGEEVPPELVDHITNPKAWENDEGQDADLIGATEDPLMKRKHDELVLAAEMLDAPGVSSQSKKADLVAAIRAAGYTGDGDDLFDEGE